MIAAVCSRWLAMVTTARSTASMDAINPTLCPNGSELCSCSWWISSSAISGFPYYRGSVTTDEAFMREALALAGQSAHQGEVPVGAVIVIDGVIAGRGSNAPLARPAPTAPSE